jgi:hypothetical protein
MSNVSFRLTDMALNSSHNAQNGRERLRWAVGAIIHDTTMRVVKSRLEATQLVELKHRKGYPGYPTLKSARAVLTNSGHDRYEQLLQRALRLPAQFLALCQRFIDDDSNPVSVPSLPD